MRKSTWWNGAMAHQIHGRAKITLPDLRYLNSKSVPTKIRMGNKTRAVKLLQKRQNSPRKQLLDSGPAGHVE